MDLTISLWERKVLTNKVLWWLVPIVCFLTLVIFDFYCPGRISNNAVLYKPDHPQIKCELSGEEVRSLNRAWIGVRRLPVSVPSTPPEYILYDRDHKILLWRSTRMACNEEDVVFNLDGDSCRVLDQVIIRLETAVADRFGVIMPWEEVKSYFAMYCRAEIIDFETGKSFMVQRRGGRYHADCQPLTRQDTAIMKEIFGRWSWERRAAIVVVGGRRIAASMSGMPHGAGQIKDNDFDGHFCVHFWGSRVHTSGRVDPEHQRQVLKAAGKI